MGLACCRVQGSGRGLCRPQRTALKAALAGGPETTCRGNPGSAFGVSPPHARSHGLTGQPACPEPAHTPTSLGIPAPS